MLAIHSGISYEYITENIQLQITIHRVIRNSKYKRSQRDSIARDKQQNQEWQSYIADFIVSWLIKFRNSKNINSSNSELHRDR